VSREARISFAHSIASQKTSLRAYACIPNSNSTSSQRKGVASPQSTMQVAVVASQRYRFCSAMEFIRDPLSHYEWLMHLLHGGCQYPFYHTRRRSWLTSLVKEKDKRSSETVCDSRGGSWCRIRVYFLSTVVERCSMPPELEWGTCLPLIHDQLSIATSIIPYIDMRLPSSRRKCVPRYFLRVR
jgi:hypothetical protein